jgi:transposase
MRRRGRLLLLALVVLLVSGAVALVVVGKPTLDDNRETVDARWNALRPPLTTRYENLDAALAALVAAGGGDRAVARDLRRDLAAWREALRERDATTQTEIANRLEGQAFRLRANLFASPRLAGVEDLTTRVGEFRTSAPRAALVRAYNRAVRTYEDDRTDTLRTPIARLFGFGDRPVLVIEP